MALLAVAVDMAVLEITPHLEHFRSSRLPASAGTLGTREYTHAHTGTRAHTHIHIYIHAHMEIQTAHTDKWWGRDQGVQVMVTGGFAGDYNVIKEWSETQRRGGCGIEKKGRGRKERKAN